VRWLYKNTKGDWVSTDAIAVNVTGGRKQGYRGYTTKANFEEGDWQIRIETSDAREIGRIYLEVKADPVAGERTFYQQKV